MKKILSLLLIMTFIFNNLQVFTYANTNNTYLKPKQANEEIKVIENTNETKIDTETTSVQTETSTNQNQTETETETSTNKIETITETNTNQTENTSTENISTENTSTENTSTEETQPNTEEEKIEYTYETLTLKVGQKDYDLLKGINYDKDKYILGIKDKNGFDINKEGEYSVKYVLLAYKTKQIIEEFERSVIVKKDNKEEIKFELPELKILKGTKEFNLLDGAKATNQKGEELKLIVKDTKDFNVNKPGIYTILIGILSDEAKYKDLTKERKIIVFEAEQDTKIQKDKFNVKNTKTGEITSFEKLSDAIANLEEEFEIIISGNYTLTKEDINIISNFKKEMLTINGIDDAKITLQDDLQVNSNQLILQNLTLEFLNKTPKFTLNTKLAQLNNIKFLGDLPSITFENYLRVYNGTFKNIDSNNGTLKIDGEFFYVENTISGFRELRIGGDKEKKLNAIIGSIHSMDSTPDYQIKSENIKDLDKDSLDIVNKTVDLNKDKDKSYSYGQVSLEGNTDLYLLKGDNVINRLVSINEQNSLFVKELEKGQVPIILKEKLQENDNINIGILDIKQAFEEENKAKNFLDNIMKLNFKEYPIIQYSFTEEQPKNNIVGLFPIIDYDKKFTSKFCVSLENKNNIIYYTVSKDIGKDDIYIMRLKDSFLKENPDYTVYDLKNLWNDETYKYVVKKKSYKATSLIDALNKFSFDGNESQDNNIAIIINSNTGNKNTYYSIDNQVAEKLSQFSYSKEGGNIIIAGAKIDNSKEMSAPIKLAIGNRDDIKDNIIVDLHANIILKNIDITTLIDNQDELILYMGGNLFLANDGASATIEENPLQKDITLLNLLEQDTETYTSREIFNNSLEKQTLEQLFQQELGGLNIVGEGSDLSLNDSVLNINIDTEKLFKIKNININNILSENNLNLSDNTWVNEISDKKLAMDNNISTLYESYNNTKDIEKETYVNITKGNIGVQDLINTKVETNNTTGGIHYCNGQDFYAENDSSYYTVVGYGGNSKTLPKKSEYTVNITLESQSELQTLVGVNVGLDWTASNIKLNVNLAKNTQIKSIIAGSGQLHRGDFTNITLVVDNKGYVKNITSNGWFIPAHANEYDRYEPIGAMSIHGGEVNIKIKPTTEHKNKIGRIIVGYKSYNKDSNYTMKKGTVNIEVGKGNNIGIGRGVAGKRYQNAIEVFDADDDTNGENDTNGNPPTTTKYPILTNVTVTLNEANIDGNISLGVSERMYGSNPKTFTTLNVNDSTINGDISLGMANPTLDGKSKTGSIKESNLNVKGKSTIKGDIKMTDARKVADNVNVTLENSSNGTLLIELKNKKFYLGNHSNNGYVKTANMKVSGTGPIQINGNIYGGNVEGSNNNCENTKIDISGNNTVINGDIYGGNDGNQNITQLAHIILSGNVTVRGNIYGGNEGAGYSNETKIEIKGGKVEKDIYLGNNWTGELKKGTVTVSGGTVNTLYLGNKETGNSNNVTANVSGGTVDKLYSGNYKNGNYKNTINITGGTVRNLYGGKASKNNSSVEINVQGGTVNNLYGENTNNGNATTNINVKSGKVDNLYGGNASNNNSTYGKNTIKVTSGTVTNLYGGNAGNGNSKSNITVSGGTITNLYGGNAGGGKLDSSTINITGGTITDLYGGNAGRGACQNTNINISRPNKNNTPKITNIYGGNAGDGSVDGSTTVNVADTNVTNIYGGNFGEGKVFQGTNVTVNNTTSQTKIYGGNAGNKQVDGIAKVTVSGPFSEVFGGNKGNGDIKSTEVTINTTNSNNSNVYGGNAGNGHISTSSKVTLKNNGTVRNIYGGNKGTGKVSNPAKSCVEIAGGTVNGDVYGGNAGNGPSQKTEVIVKNGTVKGKVFGGNQNGGEVSELSKVTITGGTVNGEIFGGNLNGKVSLKSSVEISGGNIPNNVYGGNESNGEAVETNVTINQKGVVKGNVYGGNKGNGKITKTTKITIDNGTVEKEVYGGNESNGEAVETNVTINQKGVVKGNVYGGNKGNGKITKTTKITIDNGTVEKEVYGGNLGNETLQRAEIILRNGAKVCTNTSTLANNNETRNLYGGNAGGGWTGHTYITLDGNVQVGVTSNNVNENTNDKHRKGSIFGGNKGGNECTETSITVTGGNRNNPNIENNIYGGNYGNARLQFKSTINVTNAVVDNIYGGNFGNGSVDDGTNITVNNTTGNTNVYGGNFGNGKIGGNPDVSYGKGKTNITLKQGPVKNIYGGNAGTGAIEGSTNVTLENDKVNGAVYGGNAQSGAVETTNVNINRITFNKPVYGGNAQSGLVGTTNVNINGATIEASIYGGSVTGEKNKTNKTNININGGTINKPLFVGNEKGEPVNEGCINATNNPSIKALLYGTNGIETTQNLETNQASTLKKATTSKVNIVSSLNNGTPQKQKGAKIEENNQKTTINNSVTIAQKIIEFDEIVVEGNATFIYNPPKKATSQNKENIRNYAETDNTDLENIKLTLKDNSNFQYLGETHQIYLKELSLEGTNNIKLGNQAGNMYIPKKVIVANNISTSNSTSGSTTNTINLELNNLGEDKEYGVGRNYKFIELGDKCTINGQTVTQKSLNDLVRMVKLKGDTETILNKKNLSVTANSVTERRTTPTKNKENLGDGKIGLYLGYKNTINVSLPTKILFVGVVDNNNNMIHSPIYTIENNSQDLKLKAEIVGIEQNNDIKKVQGIANDLQLTPKGETSDGKQVDLYIDKNSSLQKQSKLNDATSEKPIDLGTMEPKPIITPNTKTQQEEPKPVQGSGMLVPLEQTNQKQFQIVGKIPDNLANEIRQNGSNAKTGAYNLRIRLLPLTKKDEKAEGSGLATEEETKIEN